MDMTTFKHLLVPTDFGGPSSYATELALSLAQRFSARLTLAHFWELPTYPYASEIYTPADFAVPIAEAAEAAVAKLLAEVRRTLPAVQALCRAGTPWQDILRVVEEAHVDLIVMGTHGRRGISHVLLGSVAEKVRTLHSESSSASSNRRGSPCPMASR
jgi:nucleotide-binding universal stress UspA family protein